MTPAELLTFLQDFSRETLDLFIARQAIARSIAGYDANNGYQQVIGRQEVHLQWLSDAISALGGTPIDSTGRTQEPGESGLEADWMRIEPDVFNQIAFIERWTPRVAGVTNARNRKMLELILGEMKEHLRVLQQAAEGRADLLGRHSDGKVLRGRVMADRPRN